MGPRQMSDAKYGLTLLIGELDSEYKGACLDYLFRGYGEILNLIGSSAYARSSEVKREFLAELLIIERYILLKPARERVDFWHGLCDQAAGIEKRIRDTRKIDEIQGGIRDLWILFKDTVSRKGVFERFVFGEKPED